MKTKVSDYFQNGQVDIKKIENLIEENEGLREDNKKIKEVFGIKHTSYKVSENYNNGVVEIRYGYKPEYIETKEGFDEIISESLKLVEKERDLLVEKLTTIEFEIKTLPKRFKKRFNKL